MPIRYPAPLQPGDQIGVTAPSSGLRPDMRDRLDFCVRHLCDKGFDVVIGDCMDGELVTSAPASQRAAELTAMLTDPAIRAVVPPWGGELAIDLLSLLDMDAIATAEPTWLVGYSDTSTLMLPLTLQTGLATLHGSNLMDTPYEQPEPLLHWLTTATATTGSRLVQRPAPAYQTQWADFATQPDVTQWRLTEPARWKRLGHDDAPATGRLIGGCLDTISMLPGSMYGDVDGFAATHAPEGLLLYLEVADADALTAARMLHHLRLAGWFDAANAVLAGRPAGPDSHGFSHVDALEHALGDLGVPVVYDLDIGHVPPQLTLVNGALATVELTEARAELVQHLV